MKRLLAGGLAALAVAAIAGCAKPTAKQALEKTTAAYKKLDSVKMQGSSGAEFRVGGQWEARGSDVTIYFQKPNKVRQESKGTNQPVVISDGKKAYLYYKQDNAYVEAPASVVLGNITGSQAGVSMLALIINKDPFKGVKNPKMIGDERLGAVDTYVVEYQPAKKLGMPGMEKAKVTERIWIGKQDWLVHKRVMTANIPKEVMKGQMPPGAGDQGARLTFTADVSDLKVGAKIPSAQFMPPKNAKAISPHPMGMPMSPLGGSGHPSGR
ncbi:MAG: DUF2092 domain-containing protein [Armatimonadota bacterium]|nr:DUF2092 domain-containing protein [Armatimonadota bacterium]